MKRRDRSYIIGESLVGQVWDLDGTIVLVLEPSHDNKVKCLTLDGGVDEEPDHDDPVGFWTVYWFDGRLPYPAARIA